MGVLICFTAIVFKEINSEEFYMFAVLNLSTQETDMCLHLSRSSLMSLHKVLQFY